MTGVVTSAGGSPLAGASVQVWTPDCCRPGPTASDVTDALGGYKVNFVSRPGSYHNPQFDPPGTKEAVALAFVEASGYEWYARYVLGTDQHLVENIRLRGIQRITAGESATLTVRSDDSVCGMDSWPDRELICRTLRVVAPAYGTMTIEAVPTEAGPELPMLEVYGGSVGAPRGNPTSLRVVAGTEYTVRVQLPWGFGESRSLVVNTSIE